MLTAKESDDSYIHLAATCQKVKSICDGSYTDVPVAHLEEYIRILEIRKSVWKSTTARASGSVPATVSALWDNLHFQMLELAIAVGRQHVGGLKKAGE